MHTCLRSGLAHALVLACFILQARLDPQLTVLIAEIVSFSEEQALSGSITGPSRPLSVTESRVLPPSYAEPSMPKLISLTERLTQLATDARDRAEATPPGPKREALSKASRVSENALLIQRWLSSSGLRAPT
jgi:hypothetical protein